MVKDVEDVLRFKSLAKRVRLARKFLGMSQGDLAQQVGISQSHISRLEAGKRLRTLRPCTIVALGRALNMTGYKLVKGTLVESMVMDASGAPEDGVAFCPNPFCSTNTIQKIAGSVRIVWTSQRRLLPAAWRQCRFCAFCGEPLVKDCRACGWPIRSAGDRYCRRCQEPVNERPTEKEWQAMRRDDLPGLPGATGARRQEP